MSLSGIGSELLSFGVFVAVIVVVEDADVDEGVGVVADGDFEVVVV
jgi:hypothetical protein